jgi:2'-5' RNA ligase/GNAT superfamily N-acetyltransferase
MARQRLGVVLLLPQPLATEVDGVRRALGDEARERIAPHITLVSPVNVAERDLPRAFTLVRTAASTIAPLTLQIGPVTSFAPVNPVAYLQVRGEPQVLEALERLRDGCSQGPLERSSAHEFVPHVTVANELPEPRLDAAARVLGDFDVATTIDRVHVLAELPGRVWKPIADAPLGERPAVVGRGSLPLELTVSGRPDVEGAALLSFEEETAGQPFAVTARRDHEVVAATWGWSARGALEVADLAVAAEHRGQGIGRHLLAAVVALARQRGCEVVGAAAPAGGGAALLRAAGFRSGDAAAGDVRRWELRLRSSEADDDPS